MTDTDKIVAAILTASKCNHENGVKHYVKVYHDFLAAMADYEGEKHPPVSEEANRALVAESAKHKRRIP
jgi:hypothetical protein